MGVGGGRRDSMDREKIRRGKKKKRKGRETSAREGFTKGGKDEALLRGWGC